MNRHWLRLGVVALSVMAFWACQGKVPAPLAPTGQSASAIIGGQDDSRYPAVGSLQANRNSFCTGTLVASRLVLTAAHCITSAQSQQQRGVKIEFRIDTLSGGNITSQYHEVGTMQNHPQYGNNSQGIVNDFGVAILKADVTGVTPMPINTTAMTNVWVNRQILFLGYGLIQTQPQRRAPGQKQGGEITLRTLQADRFMTQDTGKSICSGDSGGPALYDINGTMTLIGVNSYVTGNSTSAGPLCNGSGWSFRIDAYLTWIQPLINQHGGKCKADSDCGPCYRCDTTAGKCQLKGTTPTATYCKPCSDPTQCGGSKDICVRQAVGNRCLQACDPNGCCPLGTSCQDIGGQQQCVPDSKVCADVSCTADTDCGPGEGCTNGICKPKPVPPSPTLCGKCATDADCDKGALCRDYPDGKYCTQPCVADNFCPQDYTCQLLGSSRQCVPTSGNCLCAADADCHTGFVCQAKICQRQGGGKFGDACDDTRKCATGYQCQSGAEGSTCLQECKSTFPPSSPGSACRGRTCASGTQCLSANGVRICLQSCTSDSNCTRGGKCSSVGNVKLCLCDKDSDCSAPNVCNQSLLSQFGTCSPKNTETVTCDNGFTCAYTSGSERCLPPPSQESGQECDNNRRCKDNMLCAGTSSGAQLCLRRCSNDNDCLEGGNCSRTNGGNLCLCSTNSPCNKGFQCNAFSGGTGTCTPDKCTTNQDCSNGAICTNGTCQPPQSGCLSDADCAPGDVCLGGKCTPPTLTEATPEPTRDAGTTEPTQPDQITTPDPTPQPDTVSATETPTPDKSTPTENQTSGADTITETPLPQPPPSGCGSCSINHHDPSTPTGMWWLIALFLPLLRRK